MRRVGLVSATIVLVATVAIGPACHKPAPTLWNSVAGGPVGSNPDGGAIGPNPDGGSWSERTYTITVPAGTMGSGSMAGVFVIKANGDAGGSGQPATIIGVTINNGDIGQDAGTIPLGPETDARVQQTLIGALGVTPLDQAVFYRTVVPVDFAPNQVFTVNAIVSNQFAGTMLGAGGIESSLAAGTPPPAMQQFSDVPAPAAFAAAPAAPVWALASLGLALLLSMRALLPRSRRARRARA
jgi:hypothetical protein